MEKRRCRKESGIAVILFVISFYFSFCFRFPISSFWKR